MGHLQLPTPENERRRASREEGEPPRGRQERYRVEVRHPSELVDVHTNACDRGSYSFPTSLGSNTLCPTDLYLQKRRGMP